MSAAAGAAGLALAVVIPGDLETRTGGYGYDRRIIAGLRGRGWSVDVLSFDDSFPFPTAAAREQAARALAAIPDGATVLVDGLVLGALPDEVARERRRLRIIALVHHPLAAETGLDPGVAAVLENNERRALAAVRFVVVTGHRTAAALARYGVAPDRIAIVEPGTEPAPLARGSVQRSGPVSEASEISLLCVATLTPRKGHQNLFRALAAISHRHWRLTCAGSLDRDRPTVERLRAQLRSDGLTDRVDLVGDLDAAGLAIHYDRANLFVLATLYEGYGMAVAEALARGLPVVSTATGAIPELVTDEAGIVVAPGDLPAFTMALARVMDDAALRHRFAHGARRVRDRLPTWDHAVSAMERVLDPERCETPTTKPRQRNSDSGTLTPAFSSAWLQLREPADRAARSTRLTRRIAAAFSPVAELRILDLGTGTGANFRYLATHLPERQSWLLVDHDAALLSSVPPAADGSCRVETRQLDLRALSDDRWRELLSDRGLVTASALLDLVSEQWLRALAARCRDNGAALLFTLNYDGRIRLAPEEAEDAEVRELVNQHQRTDKGFGRALGPDASTVAESVLAGLRYRVELERSDWVLEPDSHELQRQLIDGWAGAAADIAPDSAASIAAWRERRLAHVAAHRSRLIVGHEDLAATLI